MQVLEYVFFTFLGVILIQYCFHGFIFLKFALSKVHKNSQKNIPVSIIVCAKNEAQNLEKLIPKLLQQDYPKFELVLINDASTDNTLEVIEAFKAQNEHIKIVDVKNIEAFWGNKKYALTLGIKASTYDFLLFTDADCLPATNQWVKEMSSCFSNQKTIILGYGAYKRVKHSFLNLLIRFETTLTAIQYFSFAQLGMPYMAVGRNLAYRKDEFFNANGFISHIDVRSGDDDLFVNQVATSKNTAICITKNSFTESIPKTSFKDWYRQKRRHVTTAKHYKKLHKSILGLFYISQVLFWTLATILLTFQYQWKIIAVLISIRFIFQFLNYGLSAKKLNTLDTVFLLPLLEIFLIITQFFIFISNSISKTNHWR